MVRRKAFQRVFDPRVLENKSSNLARFKKKKNQLNTLIRSISQCHTGYYCKDIRSRPRFLHPISDNGRMAKQSPLDLSGAFENSRQSQFKR